MYGQPAYAPPSYPPNDYPTDSKSPYDGGRFAPKKKVNDPIFLILFLLSVSAELISDLARRF